ncbi:hypothetical protein HQ865_24580 [Mucilaginibacter mali]|uniref:Uncharacterized protein n=1 Tax=Mucilaginibacter mali TaxID=2740462 RepID=A0A7D4UH69_9SPHI|nr:hypothetical protein [Mucilaginibacter mali]QKJ32796.1 hypothetical protein HQ865_24580 [Mucilaginibacter mali]
MPDLYDGMLKKVQHDVFVFPLKPHPALSRGEGSKISPFGGDLEGAFIGMS